MIREMDRSSNGQTALTANNDITNEEKCSVLRDEIGMWKRSRYMQQMRHRSFTNLKHEEGRVMAESELERIESILDTLRTEWETLTSVPPP